MTGSIINEYVNKCEAVVCRTNVLEAKKLEDKILETFGDEFHGLDTGFRIIGDDSSPGYLGDIEKLKSKLMHHRKNI